MKRRFVWLLLMSSFILSFFVTSCGHSRYRHYNPEPIPTYVPRNDEVRVALVLGSGGARGIAHLGVLSAFEEANIPVDLLVGASAGSVIAAMYANNPKVEELIPKLKSQNKKMLLDMDMLNLRYGIYKGVAFRAFLAESMSVKTFEELQIPCIIVATDLISGEQIAFGSGEIVPCMHASCALPYFFHPVELYGRILVDGGVTNPVPVSIAKEYNPEMIIAVDITGALPKELPTNLLGVARRSIEICFQRMNGLCTADADVVITPAVKEIDTFEDKAFDQLFEAGKAAANEAIPEIKKRLSQLHSQKMGWITD